MEAKLLKRNFQSQHRQSTLSSASIKFKPLLRELRNCKQRINSSTSSHRSSNNVSPDDNRKQYINLQRKLAQKQKMKIGTRNFNKTFYAKMAKKIMQKPASFYKFGLKQDQRSSCKTVFSQLFKINKENFAGSLSVNDLWDNKIMMKYLKENQMFFNKDVLIKQFRSFDKQQKMKKKQCEKQKQREFVSKYRQWVKENQRLNKNNVNYRQMKTMNANQACTFIRTEIESLSSVHKNYRNRTKSRKIMDTLQKNYDKFDKIAGNFQERMILLL